MGLETVVATSVWIEHQTCSADRYTARFLRRLVLIHRFPEGNTRPGREQEIEEITDVRIDNE